MKASTNDIVNELHNTIHRIQVSKKMKFICRSNNSVKMG